MRDIVDGEAANTGDVTDLSFNEAMKLREILRLRQIIQHELQASLGFRQRGSRETPLMWVPSSARQLATSGDSNRVPQVALDLEEAELPPRTLPMIPNVGVDNFREGHGRDFTSNRRDFAAAPT
jgi:hypothetical protein